MTLQLAPQKIISLSFLLFLSIAAISLFLATAVPWLGLTLAPSGQGNAGIAVLEVTREGPADGKLWAGERILRIQDNAVALESSDLIEEPDALTNYRDYNAFLDRQRVIYGALEYGRITLEMVSGRTQVLSVATHRPIDSLPWLFWYQLACGGIVFLAGMSVLAFRPRERVTIYYAMTGFGLLLASSSAAIYSTRELALDGDTFYALSLINQFGSLLFAATFISILWYYPRPVHRFPFGPVFIAGYFVCWVLNFLQVYETLDAAMRYPLFVGLALNLSFAAKQWHLSKHHPVNRAILKWFLLAWLSGTTLYLALYTIPLMLELETFISQSLGWGILVTVYLGVAFGITRYRLFNLDRWVLAGWFWFLGGVAVIVVDMMLVSLLKVNNYLGLAVSLALAGWIYFPLRQMLWNRFSWYYRRNIDYQELLPSLLTTVLTTHSGKLSGEWSRLLQRVFTPLHMEAITTESPKEVELKPDGSALVLPGFNRVSGLRLTYADRGSRLFSEEDKRLAEAVYQLFSRVERFREAFNEGVGVERRRVARDLHDDVGAKLLTLVYSADTETQAELARETLQELRDVIRNLEHQDYSLLSTLEELERETARRCDSHKVSIVWCTNDEIDDYPLESRQQSNLVRSVREAVTNALRHGKARTLHVDTEQDGNVLVVEVSNDSANEQRGQEPKPGRGMRNIRMRAEELGGDAQWYLGEESKLGSYTVRITIPMGSEGGI